MLERVEDANFYQKKKKKVQTYLSGQMFEVLCVGDAADLTVRLPERVEARHYMAGHLAAELVLDSLGHFRACVGCCSSGFLAGLCLQI